ncbi:hypothetical protein ES703_67872 [subsurface metagenome]
MSIVHPAGYNSYNVHLTEKEHQTLIDGATLNNTTRAYFLQGIITQNLKLLHSINEWQNERQLSG